MIIQRIRATFGKLDDRELRLRPGLNVVRGDNEAGKSTWLACLLAMLYGVETRDRVRGDRLPDKLKFQPWSGKPMAGTMELTDGQRSITIERTSQTAPLGDFRAWDTATGSPIETLTGKTCGQTLLGVEASVYARSGCLRQHRASVSADAQLEKRLSGLVTSGNEDYAYAELDEKLKKLQTSIRHNQAGALPRAEERQRAVRERLDKIREHQSRLASMEAELVELRRDRAECRELLAALEAQDQRKKLSNAEAAETALAEAVEDRVAWENICSDLPDEETLEHFEAELDRLRESLQKTALEDGLHPDELELPALDPVFGRMSPKEASDKVTADANLIREAKAAKRPRRRSAAPLLLLILLGLGVGWFGANLPLLPVMAGGVFVAILGLGLWIWQRIEFNRRTDAYLALRQKARDLLDQYGVRNTKGVVQRGIDYIRSLEDRRNGDGGVSREILARLADRRDALLARLELVMPGCNTVEKAEILFREAAQARQSLAQARLVERQRTEQLRDLRIALEPTPEEKAEAARCKGRDRGAEAARLAELDERLTALSEQTARLSGAVEQMGDPLALEAEFDLLTRDIRRMEERYAALRLARRALTEADEALRARFAPLLCERTGLLFARLTAGRYDGIQLDRDLHVTVHPKDSPIYRPLSYLSGGTVDQLYLALRLAICQLLLPGAPILLDDALAYFDDQRAALALDALREMSKSQQVIIFTCQNREKRILDELRQKELGK